MPFLFLVAIAAGRVLRGTDRPRALIDGFVALAVISDLASELFGHFGAIGFPSLLATWAVAAVGALAWACRRRAEWHGALSFSRSPALLVVALFLSVTLLIALTAAPNNWDSQTYHLPRIEHWLQNGSLTFYPTAIDRQNIFGPLAELILLQTRALSGDDTYYLLLQWLSMATCVAAAYRIAWQLGATPTQCWIASVFVATLPIGVLESTSTQNDYVEAALLASFASLGIEAMDRPRAPLGLVVWAGCAGALAGLAKPIAFMLGCGFAVWFAIGLARDARPSAWLTRLVAAVAVLAVVAGPFATRFATNDVPSPSDNIELPTSFGPAQMLDTLIRHVASDLVIGLPAVDIITMHAANSLTAHLRLQGHRAGTTELRAPYAPPAGIWVLHEDFGPNPVHAALLILALIATVLRWPQSPTRRQTIYCLAWVAGLLAFCTLIRFGSWEVRYHLPAFVLAAPIFALRGPARPTNRWSVAALVLALAVAGLPALLLNKSREIVPLSHQQPSGLEQEQVSYFTQTPLERLLINRLPAILAYRAAVDTIVRSGATQVGLVLGQDSWEYPVWWLLRRQESRQQQGKPPLRIEHVLAPGNATWPLGPFTPDVIFWDRGNAEVPATIAVGGVDFNRIEAQSDGLGGTIAVFARDGAP